MTQEEKSKAYDEAIERAKNIYGASECKDILCTLETIFPELKESEDERIRKELLAWLKSRDGQTLPMDRYNAAIAWLEKQGEQKVSEYDIVKTIKERIIEHFDNHLIIDKCFSIGGLKDDILKIINEVKFAKQGEQKPVNLVAIMKDYFANTPKEQQDKDWEELKHLNNFGWELVEQKPAWSEEDVTMLDSAIAFVEHSAFTTIGKGKNSVIAWLKSLKNRYIPQSKQEWSEEEEEIYRNIFNHYFTIEEPTDGNGIPKEKYLNLIKSLRPQSQWKPSEELLDVFIKNAIDFFESNFNPLTDGGVIGAFDDKEKMIEEFKEYMKEEGFNEEWI